MNRKVFLVLQMSLVDTWKGSLSLSLILPHSILQTCRVVSVYYLRTQLSPHEERHLFRPVVGNHQPADLIWLVRLASTNPAHLSHAWHNKWCQVCVCRREESKSCKGPIGSIKHTLDCSLADGALWQQALHWDQLRHGIPSWELSCAANGTRPFDTFTCHCNSHPPVKVGTQWGGGGLPVGSNSPLLF